MAYTSSNIVVQTALCLSIILYFAAPCRGLVNPTYSYTLPKRYDGEVQGGSYPSPLHTVHVVPLLSNEEVERILPIATHYGKSTGRWEQPDFDRHSTYATCDFAVEDCEELINYLDEIDFQERMFQCLSDLYNVSREDLSFLDFFCAHYQTKSEENPNAMDRLEPHRDGSLLSFTLTLTPPDLFESGGTYFAGLQDVPSDGAALKSDGVVKPTRAGDVVLHSGKVLHGANTVISGDRTVLVGFVDVNDFLFRPGSLSEACRDWGRMDVATFMNKRFLKKTDNGSKKGWVMKNERWIQREDRQLERGRSALLGVCPAKVLEGIKRRANPTFQNKKKLEAEDILLRRILMSPEEIEQYLHLNDDFTIL